MSSTKLFLFASPSESYEVLKITRSCTFFSYFIGKNGTLEKKSQLYGNNSPLMYISDFGIEDFESLNLYQISREIASECQKKHFSGIFADFENPQSFSLLKTIYQNLQNINFTFFIPKLFANSFPKAKIIIPSAISGGSFEQMLLNEIEKYGAERICLDIMKICQEFEMPSYMPEGKDLSCEDFENLLNKQGNYVFFSKELCSKYFTYRQNDGSYRFVIFDDYTTAKEKIEIAKRLQLHSVFLLYSDFKADIIHLL